MNQERWVWMEATARVSRLREALGPGMTLTVQSPVERVLLSEFARRPTRGWLEKLAMFAAVGLTEQMMVMRKW